MLDMQEVSNTIRELESGPTTLENCRKLAILYIVKEHYSKANLPDCGTCTDKVVEEYRDILPTYSDYCEAKRRFQLREIPEESVLQKLQLLCQEVEEFLSILYTNTESDQQRELIAKSIGSFTL